MNTGKSVAELAYALWEARGCPHGSSEQDWLEAERLAARSAAAMPPSAQSDDEASIDSFPASAPLAGHSPDVPVGKAGEKRSAAKEREVRSREKISADLASSPTANRLP
jgi:hypothetical protein